MPSELEHSAPEQNWLNDFSKYVPELLVGTVCLIVFLGAMHWLCWLMRWGRYREGKNEKESSIAFVIADFFVKLINDFRHLLALLVLGIFGWTLHKALSPGVQARDMGMIENGLKSVVTALGPTVALMIGYYFGESASRRKGDVHRDQPKGPGAKPPVTQEPCQTSGIEAVGAPPTVPDVAAPPMPSVGGAGNAGTADPTSADASNGAPPPAADSSGESAASERTSAPTANGGS